MDVRVVDIRGKWSVVIVYGRYEGKRLYRLMADFGIPLNEAEEAVEVLARKNKGYTFSLLGKKRSLTVIGEATSRAELWSTVVHEIKHLQSHICYYYDIDEASEDAAYLVGYLAQRIYYIDCICDG